MSNLYLPKRDDLDLALCEEGLQTCATVRDGAQGRDRTTDTAIFSRMLYQLSYLGVARERARRAPVYSQASGPCPPGISVCRKPRYSPSSSSAGRPGMA